MFLSPRHSSVQYGENLNNQGRIDYVTMKGILIVGINSLGVDDSKSSRIKTHSTSLLLLFKTKFPT